MDGRWNAGMELRCPRCDAAPGEPCRNQHGVTRLTTHQERKPEETR